MPDTDTETTASDRTPSAGWFSSLLFSLLFLGGGGVAIWFIFLTEPEAQREGASKKTAMLVRITGVEQGDFRPLISATGTVRPARELVLRPRVGGEVIERAADFVPGGFVRAGETLLRLDPADYEIQLAQRSGELHQAQADLEIEMGQQAKARDDLRALQRNLSPERRKLVLREPQLAQASARVAMAEAAVEQAELNLARTEIRAPFDAAVLERQADLGGQVSVGDALGRVAGTEVYWVEATVPLAKLARLRFPKGDAPGSRAEVRQRSGWPEGQTRTGRLFRMIGELEGATRMARVLIEVADPLGRDGDHPALLIGAFVEVRIQGEPLEDVIRLDRDQLRKEDTVWVMRDGKLHIAEPEVIFLDQQYVYIRDGLAPDAQVVTSHLSTVTEGAPLRLRSEDG